MSAVKDTLLNVEKHRLQLEENVNQLRKALQHWQTWDAEYEALKEEVEAVPEQSPAAELQKAHDDFEGEFLVGKEIDEIFGLQDQRPRNQILNVLQRRIDYVGKNVETLQKQLDAAEDKLAEATISEAMDEDGQPITEIVEQLDDDNNVVSYRLNRPGDSFPKVQEALEKAGVDELPVQQPALEDAATHTDLTQDRINGLSLRPKPRSPRQAEDAPKSPIQLPSAKKSVSFSQEVDSVEPSEGGMSVRARRVDQIMKSAKEQESISNNQSATIPEDEDEEDAELRRQMLKYSMGEVGAVVAELQLEEGGFDDDDSGFEYGDDDFDHDADFDDDDEDRFGRTTSRMITDDYKQRMLELEQKLGIKSRFTENAQPDEEEGDSDIDTEGMGRIVVKRGTGNAPPSASNAAPSKSSIKGKQAGETEGKKGVRFAQALDIAQEDDRTLQRNPEVDVPQVEPLSDIVERTTSVRAAESKATRKPSRFKKAMREPTTVGGIPKGPFDVPAQMVMHDEIRTVPTGPDGATLADQLVERGPTTKAVAPTEFDDSLVHQEVADEHHRLRKKFIQREGGFLKEDESPIQPLDEADGGEPISRFKAARLSRQ